MVKNVNKSSITQNIFKNFYDIANAGSKSNGKIFPLSREVYFENEDDYPTIVLESPSISWGPFTWGKNVLDGTINFTVKDKEPEKVDELVDEINNQIETSKGTLANQGIKDVRLSEMDSDLENRGKIVLTTKDITFEFKYRFDATRAF